MRTRVLHFGIVLLTLHTAACSSDNGDDSEGTDPGSQSNAIADVCTDGNSSLVFNPNYDHICEERGQAGIWIRCSYVTDPPDNCWTFPTQASENYCCDKQAAYDACVAVYDDDRCYGMAL